MKLNKNLFFLSQSLVLCSSWGENFISGFQSSCNYGTPRILLSSCSICQDFQHFSSLLSIVFCKKQKRATQAAKRLSSDTRTLIINSIKTNKKASSFSMPFGLILLIALELFFSQPDKNVAQKA